MRKDSARNESAVRACRAEDGIATGGTIGGIDFEFEFSLLNLGGTVPRYCTGKKTPGGYR